MLSSQTKLPLDKLYFKDADNGRPAVSKVLYDSHDQRILTMSEYLQHSETLRKIAATLSADKQWHETAYTPASLRGQGFVDLNRSTICAVNDGGGAFIICIYTVGVKPKNMLPLADYTIGHDDERLVKAVRGQSEVNTRGSKPQSGTMNMYGSWACYGERAAHGANKAAHPAVYMPKHRSDDRLNTMVSAWASEMADMERVKTPSSAKLRMEIAEKADPVEMHRMSKDCPAFSLSMASTYIVGPHDDSGVANEFIVFQNRTGPLPNGHEWLFTIPGFLFRLPTKLDKAVRIIIPGSGVYHGTLPTSSTQRSHSHGNIGSALVTKKPIVEACEKQRNRGENTLDDSGPDHVASLLYGVKTLAELSKVQPATNITVNLNLNVQPTPVAIGMPVSQPPAKPGKRKISDSPSASVAQDTPSSEKRVRKQRRFISFAGLDCKFK